MTGKTEQSGDSKKAVDYCDLEPFEIDAEDHHFTFYPAGPDRRSALIDVISEAQDSLHVYYYLFQPDDSGAMVRDALIDAAKRGVEVHLIVDAFGSDAPDEFFEPMTETGARFHKFLPDWNNRYLIRNHQKYCIADCKVVMAGGFNVSDHYFGVPKDNSWCDLGVRIEGPVVEQFCDWYDCINEWITNDGAGLRRIREMVKQWQPPEGKVQLLLGGPQFRTSQWLVWVKKDLAKAKRLDLVAAYFSPQRSVRRAMAKVARKGQARLILPGKSDIDAMIAAARALYNGLLRSGAKIREFTACKLHMKLIVIDDIAYVGSANLDRRSTRVNLELMVRIENAQVAEKLRELIDHMESASDEITLDWYREKSTFAQRMKWRAAYMMTSFDFWLSRTLNLE